MNGSYFDLTDLKFRSGGRTAAAGGKYERKERDSLVSAALKAQKTGSRPNDGLKISCFTLKDILWICLS